MDAPLATFPPPPPADRQKAAKTFGYYIACAALGLVSASLGPTLPGLAAHTKSAISGISLLFTARSGGYLLGSIQGGRLYDRMPGHPVMASALLIMAAMMVGAPFAPWAWLLFAVWLATGMAEGAVDVGVNTLLIWVHGDRVGPYMQALHFFFGVGAFVSPLIVAWAIRASGDITWAYLVLAALIVPILLWVARLRSPARACEETAAEGRPAVRFSWPLVGLISALLFFYVGTEASFGGWVYSYAVALGLGNVSVAAYLTSAFWGSLTLGRLLAIPLASRFPPAPLLLADLLGGLLSIGLILLWPGSLAALWIGTLGLGLAMASVFPVALCLAQNKLTITGKITSIFFIGSSSGGMIVPWLIGQLFERVGPRATMLVIGVDLLAALVVFFLLYRQQGRAAA